MSGGGQDNREGKRGGGDVASGDGAVVVANGIGGGGESLNAVEAGGVGDGEGFEACVVSAAGIKVDEDANAGNAGLTSLQTVAIFVGPNEVADAAVDEGGDLVGVAGGDAAGAGDLSDVMDGEWWADGVDSGGV